MLLVVRETEIKTITKYGFQLNKRSKKFYKANNKHIHEDISHWNAYPSLAGEQSHSTTLEKPSSCFR